jgi:hypothetical protein
MRRGSPGPRPEPEANTGHFPPETGAPVPGGRNAQEQRNNSKRSSRNPSACLAGGRRRHGPPATCKPASGATRIGARAEARAHARPRRRRLSGAVTTGAGVRDAGGGPCRRRITRVEEPKEPSEAHAGSLVGVGSGGRGRHERLGLPCVYHPYGAAVRTTIPRGNDRFYPSLWALGSRGPGRRSGSTRRDRTTGRDRLSARGGARARGRHMAVTNGPTGAAILKGRRGKISGLRG